MQIKTIPTHEKDPQEEKAPRKLLETTSVKMARFIDEHDMENRNEKGKAHFRSVKKNRSNRISRDYKKNTAVEITAPSTSATEICIPLGDDHRRWGA